MRAQLGTGGDQGADRQRGVVRYIAEGGVWKGMGVEGNSLEERSVGRALRN